jgi:Rps23 Pro-64 3,4-dihydroxylase Tpa1-like proline 4-hydroxylase
MIVKTFSHLFPVCIGDYPFAKDLKEELSPMLENYPDKQDRKTNVKATMTEWDIKSPQINKFKVYILNELNKFLGTKTANAFKVRYQLRYINCWANIYNKGDYTIKHDHFPCYWSFVYFLETKWYHSSLKFSDSGKGIRPKEGRFVFFPGYVWHHVNEHKFKEQRITLSGNLDMVEV